MLKVTAIGKRFRIKRQLFHPLLFAESVIVPGIPFVCSNEILFAKGLEGGNGIRLIHPKKVGICGDVYRVVLIACIKAISRQTLILETKRQDTCDPPGRDIKNGDGIVFLQRDPGPFGILGNGNIFRLQVLGDRGAGAKDPDPCRLELIGPTVKGTKSCCCDSGDCNTRGNIDDAHRAFRINSVGIIRLTLVGYQHLCPIRRKGEHVRQGSHCNAF